MKNSGNSPEPENPWRPSTKLTRLQSEAILVHLVWGDSIGYASDRTKLPKKTIRDNYSYFLDVLFSDPDFATGLLDGLAAVYAKLPTDAPVGETLQWAVSLIPWLGTEGFSDSELYCAFDCAMSLSPSDVSTYRGEDSFSAWPAATSDRLVERLQKRQFIPLRLEGPTRCGICKSNIMKKLPGTRNRLEYLYQLSHYRDLKSNKRQSNIFIKAVMNIVIRDFLYFINSTFAPSDIADEKGLIWNLAPTKRANNEANLKRLVKDVALRFILHMETSSFDMRRIALRHFEKKTSIIYHYREIPKIP